MKRLISIFTLVERYLAPVTQIRIKRFTGDIRYLDRYKTVPYDRFYGGPSGDIFDLTFDETFD